MSAVGKLYVIILSNPEEKPDLEVTVTAAVPLNAILLAGHIIKLFKICFECDPIVEIQP